MIRRIMTSLAILALWGCAPIEQRPEAVVDAPPIVAAAPVPPTEPAEGGIGGTGIVVAGQEGGIGGTGAPRRAGALGTVTGFGSIHINGLRVIFPSEGSVPSPSGFIFERDIDLGETLEVLGELQLDGTVKPTEAMFRFPLVGQIKHVDPSGTKLRIMGATVVLEPGALVVDEMGHRAQLIVGDAVQVSGLSRGEEVVASRVEKMVSPVRTGVMGRVEAGAMPGMVRVNGVRVDYGASRPPQLGWSVRVTGTYEAGRLVPYETIRSLMETVSVPVSDLSVEGFLEPRAAPIGLGIGGFGHEFDPQSKVAPLSGSRALFIGSLESGTFKARHGLSLPEESASRRALLEAVENGFAPSGAIETR